MLNLFKSTPKSRYARMELIAQGRIAPKKSDFEISKEGASLIHLACLWNNLSLLKQCLLYTSIHTKDFWGEVPSYYAFRGQSLDVLQFLVTEYNLPVASALDKYEQAQWWAGFSNGVFSQGEGNATARIFDTLRYQDYIAFLNKHQVDFNYNKTGFFGESLAYKLLQSYTFKPLLALLKNAPIDFDQDGRTDHPGMTLAHWCAYMEDSRAAKFEEHPVPYIREVYQIMLTNSNPHKKNNDGDDVVTLMCKMGYRYALNKILKAHALRLTKEQFLWLNRSSKEKFLQNAQARQEYGDMIFYKVNTIKEDLLETVGEPLFKGIDDREINKEAVKSLAELDKMKKHSVGNYEIYYN